MVFGDDPDINIKNEVTAWRDWVKFNIEGSKRPKDLIIPRALKCNGPEQWLADQLKAIYSELEASEAKPALLIILYSGHGYAVRDASFTEWTRPEEDGCDRSSPKACLDWSWISSQLRPPAKLDHWLIYDTCFAGNAIFAGTGKLQSTEPRFPVNAGVLHSFCAVGPALKRKSRFRKPKDAGRTATTGAHSLNKIVLDALRQLHTATESSSLISSVWRAVSAQGGFHDMLGLAAQAQAMTEDELEENLFKDEATPKKLLKREAQMLLRVCAAEGLERCRDADQGEGSRSPAAAAAGGGDTKKDKQPANAKPPPPPRKGGTAAPATDKKAAKPVDAAAGRRKLAVAPAPVKKK